MLDWITGVIENVFDFSNVLNISITASWVVLAVLLARLVLKKAPKWIHVALWGIVAIRLLLPFSVESIFSLIPSAETVPSHVMQSEGTQLHDSAHLDIVTNPYFAGNMSLELSQSNDRVQISMMIMTFVWLAGIAAMLIYTAVSYVRLRRNVSTAVLLRDNVYQSENVTSPFVLGLLRPIIYLPFKVDGQSMEHIIAHEQAHIRRRDYIWKPLGFLLLSIHWFNPVMWVAYILLCRDIELACDEKVIKDLGNEQRADYSQALLDCSINRWSIAACPLAFGEVGVKERVTSVLNYKKPAFWLIIAAIIVCAVVAVCFLTNPLNTRLDTETEAYLHNVILEECRSEHTDYNYPCEDHIVLRAEKDGGVTTVYALVRYAEYSFNNGEITEETGLHIPAVITLDMEGAGYSAVCRWAEDGTRYVPSIKEMFPFDLRSKAINIHRYSAEQSQRCLEQAEKYFFLSDTDDINIGVEIPTTDVSPTLSLNDVIILSQKGYDLTWEDFSGYEYKDIGSGLYIHSFYINDLFSLSVGGTSTEGQPMYICLNANDGTGEFIDIRDGGVTEFIGKHNTHPDGIDYSAIPDKDYPLEGDYLTLHEALYCIEYARTNISTVNVDIPEQARAESVYCFPYYDYIVTECSFFGNGEPCDEWKQDPWHPYPFHSDSESFLNYEPRPAWGIVVSHPESEANATETIYVDAQTGDMYNDTKSGGYYPSPFTANSEYARLLAIGQDNTADFENGEAYLDSIAAAEMINQLRFEHGLNALTVVMPSDSSGLYEASAIRFKEIKQKASHTRPNGKNFATAFDSVSGSIFGEVIGVGQPTAALMFHEWMNHSYNKKVFLIDAFTHMCILAGEDENGQTYWLVTMCALNTEETTSSNNPSDDSLVQIRNYLPGVYVDMKYSSYDNFTGQIIYDFTEPSLRYGTVKKLYLVQQELLELGYSLKIWDAYRPFSVQERLWEICPDPKYVSNPSSGNLSHCRGSAIDVTLVLADGTEIEMPTGFDDFTALADRDYSDVSPESKDNAMLLQSIMEKNGFKGYYGEWWHYADTDNYDIIK